MNYTNLPPELKHEDFQQLLKHTSVFWGQCTWDRPLCFSAFNCTLQGKLTEHVAQLVPDHHQALGEPRKVTTMADEATVILPQQISILLV